MAFPSVLHERGCREAATIELNNDLCASRFQLFVYPAPSLLFPAGGVAMAGSFYLYTNTLISERKDCPSIGRNRSTGDEAQK